MSESPYALEPKSVTVNNREYFVTPFNPIDMFHFYHNWTNAVAYGKPLNDLGLKVLGQCRTSDNRALSDKMAFGEHFAKYPEDMMPLEKAAKEALLAPFERQSESTS